MKITVEQVERLNPCDDSLAWYRTVATGDLLTDLKAINSHNPSWARWLYTRLMSVRQRRMLAIYAAEQVLPIFENKYPEDDRPRRAIDALCAALTNDSEENRAAAADAAYAAYAAAAAAAAAAADAADAAAAAARIEMQERIIVEAVRILEVNEL